MDIKRHKSEVERLKAIIADMHAKPETKQLAVALSYTNKYLHELLMEEMCRKDENGFYIHNGYEKAEG